ncbi:hypothetical protein ACLOJK_038829 [Asimina triloba]
MEAVVLVQRLVIEIRTKPLLGNALQGLRYKDPDVYVPSVQEFSLEMEPIMQGEDHQTPRMPVLARLDRLDRLVKHLSLMKFSFKEEFLLLTLCLAVLSAILLVQLQFLEERQNPSYAHNSCSSPSNKEVGKQCQPLSSELEEVRFKGTLIECVAMLENRILQLSTAVNLNLTFFHTLHNLITLQSQIMSLCPMRQELSLDMEEGSTSSSSTIPTSGKLRNLFTEQDNGDVMDSYQEENHDKVKILIAE